MRRNSVKMQVVQFAAGIVFAFVCLPREASSQENSYEKLVYWLEEDNYNKLNQEKLVMSNFEYSEQELVSFWIYTRERSDVDFQLMLDDPTTLTLSGFDQDKPTKIIIHGWLGDSKSLDSVCSTLKAEYFAMGDYNVVCVDWAALALDLSYFTARLRCKAIGNLVAELITMLTNCTSQTTDDIHVLGFSMGAHIAGYAGKRLDGQLHRITGMDPAKPLFPHSWKNHRLSDGDAQFVDVIHTTKLILGQSKPFGDIDFYPNYKYTEQPGCMSDYVYGEICSHFLAFQFYARSIRDKDDFKSVKCRNVKDYENSMCEDDDFTYMGEYVNSRYLLFISFVNGVKCNVCVQQ